MESKISIFLPTSNLCNLLVLVFFCFAACPSLGRLSFNFYATSCPAAELMVSNTVRAASSNDPTIPGKLLRLLFHDCFVEGCDASVLLQGNGTERSDPANTSLGGSSVIDSAKRVLEIFCPGTVSCADIIALAARDAVAIAGGPAFQIPTGRKDGRISNSVNVRPNIVDTSFTMDEMIKLFNSKGLSLDDLVTLSGFDGFIIWPYRLVDTSLDITYAKELSKKCPAGGSSTSNTVSNDPETSFAFDNQYYGNLLAHKGLFQSDSVLLEDGRTRKQVEEFANNEERFFRSWGESFLKLTTIEVKTDNEGEIRQSCSFTN
ncbi:hypothetical protein GOBAR_AA29952 [Gossypium barbadense]|uniref:Peroxidase n=1 Tax=Gossypium barbadense TaxID=3634 RepID=A0A2P5WI32_GOSBA|nr:hypothetical protein GOBAR_AA29952 [Gossypium barbadense]